MTYHISCAETGNPNCDFSSQSEELDVAVAQFIGHERELHAEFFAMMTAGKSDAEVMSMVRSMARTK